ncbi:hypothetical protein QAD02_019742 [Eretmocerus hayati]|uniref:Uncharacterized protein n=1 Tax=Eretmocerus hayati TaxID=131215 RepID=A0ACC2PK42_9HYME|nr:hypothetical protein QAD02_019742 [Eretmocerus hayati]
MANFIRCSAGRSSVPINYKQCVAEKSKLLENFYKQGYYEFDTGKDKKGMRPVIYADAEELLRSILNSRDEIGNDVSDDLDESSHESVDDDEVNIGFEENDDLKMEDRCWRLRTYGDLREDYQKYCKLGNKKNRAPECHNILTKLTTFLSLRSV